MEIAHVRCEAGEKAAITSKPYLSPLPKIESAEMMFSASRSRRLQIVPIIQSFAQLDKNYGKEGGEIIVDNTQITLFGGFAPNSSSADVLSKALGSRTVMTGSVSRSKNDPSQSLQMTERPLMTPDELKSLPKGDFIVMKTGVHPIRVHLKLFFKWGIEFDEEHPYTVQENGNRKVEYANKDEIIDGIKEKYPQPSDEKPPPNKGNEGGGYIPPDQMMDDGNYPATNRRIEESSDEKTDESPMDNNDLETAEKEEKHSSFGGLTDEKLQGIEKESQSEQNNH